MCAFSLDCEVKTVNIKDLIVSAEDVQTGKRIIGYVCGCKSCRTAFPDEKYDHKILRLLPRVILM